MHRGGRFPTGRAVTGQTLQFSLPTGVFACDISVFTIWCQAARQHFTAINIPSSTFVSEITKNSALAGGSTIHMYQ